MKAKMLAGLLAVALIVPVAALATGSHQTNDSPFSKGAELRLASAGSSSVDFIVTFEEGADRATLLQRHGLDIVANMQMVPIAYAVGNADAWRSLAREDGVLAIEVDEPYEYHMDTALLATRVDQVHAGEISIEALRGKGNKGPHGEGVELPLRGEGIGIAVVDSGVDITHPDLADRIVPGRNLRHVPWLVRVAGVEIPPDTYVHVAGDSDAHNGHGTHVSGISLGDGTASDGRVLGVAPEARLYAYGHGAGISIISFASAYDHMLANRQEPDEPPIVVSNNSFGGGGMPRVAESVLLRRVVEAGITVVFAAGNSYDEGPNADTVNRLCKIKKETAGKGAPPLPGIICVANYSDGQTGSAEGGLASSSSRGLKADRSTWADISAPGHQIQSARAKGALVASSPAFATRYGKTELPHYITISGTSMAAPHVTGVVALMNQAAASRGVTLTPGEIEAIIKDTAHEFENYAPYPNRHAGHGLIDARAAVERVLEKDVTPMSEDRRTYSNLFEGIIFSGTGRGLNTGAAGSIANDITELEGFDRPVPFTGYVTPGASTVSLRALADDAGSSDLAKAQRSLKVCATVTYLGSGVQGWKGCLDVHENLTQFNSPAFDYSYPSDGDISATFTFDVNGDGVISPYSDRVVTVLYPLSP